MTTIYDLEQADQVSNGTFNVGTIQGLNYNQLVAILGEPTYNEETGDGKVQIEWVVEFEDKFFTIYDWKTYDREYTINENTTWNVGGMSGSFDFIQAIESQIKEEE